MSLDYCTKISREIRKLGYAPKTALRFARFIFIIQVSLCCLMGINEILSQVEHNRNTGSGELFSGARAGTVSPDFSGRR